MGKGEKYAKQRLKSALSKLEKIFIWTPSSRTSQVIPNLTITAGDTTALESHIFKEGQTNALRSLWIFYPAIYQALPNSILPVDFNIKDTESQWVDFLSWLLHKREVK